MYCFRSLCRSAPLAPNCADSIHSHDRGRQLAVFCMVSKNRYKWRVLPSAIPRVGIDGRRAPRKQYPAANNRFTNR